MLRLVCCCLCICLSSALPAAQAALIVTGLTGDEAGANAQQAELAAWRSALAGGLTTVIDGATPEARARIIEGVRALAARTGEDAVLVFIGQASTRGGLWRFQNRGARLTVDDLAMLPGTLRSLTVVYSGPGGAGLAPHLAGERTLVIAASDDPGDVNRTEFGGQLADILAVAPDRPLAEAIDAAAVATSEIYRARSAIPTERAAVWWPGGARLSCPLHPPMPQVLLARWTLRNLAVPMGFIPAGPATPAVPATAAVPGTATVPATAAPPAIIP